jgi:hypothetical protein
VSLESILLDGSSAIKIDGFDTRALAIATLCASPPENSIKKVKDSKIVKASILGTAFSN